MHNRELPKLPKDFKITATKLDEIPASQFVEAHKEIKVAESKSENEVGGELSKEQYGSVDTTKRQTKEAMKEMAFGGKSEKALEKQVGNELGLKGSEYWQRRNLFVKILGYLRKKCFKDDNKQ